jgi:hypothetical protein
MRIMRFAEAHSAGSLHREVGKDEMDRLMSRETLDWFTKGDLDSLVGSFETADWDGEVRQLLMKFDKMGQRQNGVILGIDLFDQSINPSLACQKMRENGWRLDRTRHQPNRILVTCENLNKISKGKSTNLYSVRERDLNWTRGNKHTIDVRMIDIVKSSDDFFFCEVVYMSAGEKTTMRARHYVCDGIAGLTALVADLREEQRIKRRQR